MYTEERSHTLNFGGESIQEQHHPWERFLQCSQPTQWNIKQIQLNTESTGIMHTWQTFIFILQNFRERDLFSPTTVIVYHTRTYPIYICPNFSMNIFQFIEIVYLMTIIVDNMFWDSYINKGNVSLVTDKPTKYCQLWKTKTKTVWERGFAYKW